MNKLIPLLFLSMTSVAFSQTKTLTGTIKDSQSLIAVPGVTVQIKGSTTGTKSDAAGRYSISVSATDTLEF